MAARHKLFLVYMFPGRILHFIKLGLVAGLNGNLMASALTIKKVCFPQEHPELWCKFSTP